MDERDLHRRARRAFEGTGKSQSDVAQDLSLNRSSISRALRNAGLKYAAVQARIISLLDDAPVQRRSTYDGRRVEHKWIVDPS